MILEAEYNDQTMISHMYTPKLLIALYDVYLGYMDPSFNGRAKFMIYNNYTDYIHADIQLSVLVNFHHSKIYGIK